MPDGLDLIYRASVFKEWRHSEGYLLFCKLLEQLSETEMEALLRDGSAFHDTHAGVIRGIGMAQRLVEQTLLDEQRLRPQEAQHG